MTLSDAIEKMRKHRLLIGITDGEKSDRATALDMLLGIAKRELTKQESREDKAGFPGKDKSCRTTNIKSDCPKKQ